MPNGLLKWQELVNGFTRAGITAALEGEDEDMEEEDYAIQKMTSLIIWIQTSQLQKLACSEACPFSQ